MLEVKGLTKKYLSFTLHEVSFTLEPGYILGLTGRNGAGKTTLLHQLVHPETASGGSVIIDDFDAKKEPLQAKQEIVPAIVRKKPFHDMTVEERAEAVRENPLYGNLVCRCEVVTEAEIREAIRRPVGATTIDGVKRRTRGGMGRCQGGFCSPRVAEILAEELGIPVTQVTKSGGNSFLLTGSIGQALKEEGK